MLCIFSSIKLCTVCVFIYIYIYFLLSFCSGHQHQATGVPSTDQAGPREVFIYVQWVEFSCELTLLFVPWFAYTFTSWYSKDYWFCMLTRRRTQLSLAAQRGNRLLKQVNTEESVWADPVIWHCTALCVCVAGHVHVHRSKRVDLDRMMIQYGQDDKCDLTNVMWLGQDDYCDLTGAEWWIWFGHSNMTWAGWWYDLSKIIIIIMICTFWLAETFYQIVTF